MASTTATKPKAKAKGKPSIKWLEGARDSMVTKGKMSKAEAKKWFDAKVKEHGLKAA